MFIIVNKIITEYKKESDGKTNVKNPTTGKPIPEGYKIVPETIRKDEIKAARPWHKASVHKDIEGDITALYMLDLDRAKGTKAKPAEIHIAESHDSFNMRLGATPLNG